MVMKRIFVVLAVWACALHLPEAQPTAPVNCRQQFFLKYDHDFSGQVWQSVNGQVYVENGRAVFKGEGYLTISFFAGNDLEPGYRMEFTIRPQYPKAIVGAQAVISNSMDSKSASLLVYVDGNVLTLVVRQRQPYGGVADDDDDGHFVVIDLPIASESVNVTISQYNDSVTFTAGGNTKTAKGRLPAMTSDPLYIGTGADPRGRPVTKYSGTFDSFAFARCTDTSS